MASSSSVRFGGNDEDDDCNEEGNSRSRLIESSSLSSFSSLVQPRRLVTSRRSLFVGELSDEEIQDIYDRDIVRYQEPEKRFIEQVILGDEDEAQAVAKKIQADQIAG